MALSTYATMVANRAELDWTKNNDLLSMVENSPKSRQYTEMFRAANPGGAFAWEVTVPTFTNDNLVALQSDGYQTATTYAHAYMDPSSVSYAKHTDGSLTPKCDRICIALRQIAELEQMMHPVGNQLLALTAQAAQQKIRDKMSEHLLSAIESHGQQESAGSPFVLTPTTEATFKTDWDEIQHAMRKQDGGNYEDWVMVLPSLYEGKMAMLDIIGNRDYVADAGQPGSGGVVSGRVYGGLGVKIVFSNHFSDNDTGFIFNLNKVALITPLPIQAKSFTDYATPLSNFYAFFKPWGIQTLGKEIATYADTTSTTQKEGIIALSLA